MRKSRWRYPPEFRQRIVELVRKGRTPEELTRQFEPSAQAIPELAPPGGPRCG
jgi:transposase